MRQAEKGAAAAITIAKLRKQFRVVDGRYRLAVRVELTIWAVRMAEGPNLPDPLAGGVGGTRGRYGEGHQYSERLLVRSRNRLEVPQ